MSTLHSDWFATPDFHPEFGFLCPSPRRRRRMRLAMTLMMAGAGIGGTIELAVAHWRDSDAVAQSLIADPIDEKPLAEDTAAREPSGIAVVSVRPSASAAAAEVWTVLPPHGSCKNAVARDLAASFLNSICRPGKVHARHAERTPYRIATIIIGRVASPPAPVHATPYAVTAKEKP